MPAKNGHTRVKTPLVLNFATFCPTYQVWALSRMSFKLRYPIKAKKSQRFLQNVIVWISTRIKMTVINVLGKRQKRLLFCFEIFTKVIIAKPKVSIQSKIQSFSQLKNDFFEFLFVSLAELQPLFYCILALPRFSTSRLHLASSRESTSYFFLFFEPVPIFP